MLLPGIIAGQHFRVVKMPHYFYIGGNKCSKLLLHFGVICFIHQPSKGKTK